MGCGSSLGSVLTLGQGSSPLSEAGNFLGTTSHAGTVNPNWYDPLGPTSFDKKGAPVFSPTGGVPLRGSIFNQFGALQPTISANSNATASALRAGAANPGWQAAQNLATDQINGKYLNGSPELDSAIGQMRRSSNAEAADNNARVRSNFERNGMTFGTANEQAEQSNQASNTANANSAEAQARLANYTNERGIQQQSPAMLDTAISQPTNYLAAIPNQYLAPLSQEAQVVSGLSSGGQIVQPDTLVRPGAGTELLQGIGSL